MPDEKEDGRIFYVYILEVKDRNGNSSLYTGYTNDLLRRFGEHKKSKGARYTRGKNLRLVYYEIYDNRSQAMKREIEIKKMPRKRKMALIESFPRKSGNQDKGQ